MGVDEGIKTGEEGVVDGVGGGPERGGGLKTVEQGAASPGIAQTTSCVDDEKREYTKGF